MPRLPHTFCYLDDIESLAFIVVSSIWRRNWASTPCGLATCRPWWASASCSGVPCSGGEAGLPIFLQQVQINKWLNCDFIVFPGRFGDLFGARTALSVACSSSVVFFLLLAAANHPAMLFVHKLPTLFMHIIPSELSS